MNGRLLSVLSGLGLTIVATPALLATPSDSASDKVAKIVKGAPISTSNAQVDIFLPSGWWSTTTYISSDGTAYTSPVPDPGYGPAASNLFPRLTEYFSDDQPGSDSKNLKFTYTGVAPSSNPTANPGSTAPATATASAVVTNNSILLSASASASYSGGSTGLQSVPGINPQTGSIQLSQSKSVPGIASIYGDLNKNGTGYTYTTTGYVNAQATLTLKNPPPPGILVRSNQNKSLLLSKKVAKL